MAMFGQRRKISQETFDECVQENMDEFKAFMTEGLDLGEMANGKSGPLPTAEEVFGYL